MAIVSQNPIKHDFIVPSGRNQRKKLRSFTTFMQNKPNFQKSQMNVIIFSTKAYENLSNWTLGENKPNSNPISVKPKMSANVFITKDYENETAFRFQKKTNPIKACPERSRMGQFYLPPRVYFGVYCDERRTKHN